MSPSESDLRAALRDGEGDDISVDRLILVAQAGAARRRTRLLTTAAVVAVLACAGVGGGLLANSGSGDSGSASDAFAAGGRPADSANGGSAHGAAAAPTPLPGQGLTGNGAAGSGASAGCPPTAADAARVTRAAKTTTTNSTRVFAAPVARVLVCAYGYAALDAPTAPRPSPTSLDLRGAAASRLVSSLERAPTRRPEGMCPLVRGPAAPLLMIGIAANGSVAGTASTVLPTPVCNVVALSAGVPRFHWSPPADLGPVLRAVPQTAVPSHQIRPSPISS